MRDPGATLPLFRASRRSWHSTTSPTPSACTPGGMRRWRWRLSAGRTPRPGKPSLPRDVGGRRRGGRRGVARRRWVCPVTNHATQPAGQAVLRPPSAAADIEEITQRTHNFKSFPVFVRMLITALRQESDSVFVDLLTYGDLELLKSQRAGAAQQQAAGGGVSLPPNNKRYLILTYAAEFDRVHYPLPLQQEDPDPQRLKAIIRQLRQQLGGAGQQQRARAACSARRQSDSLPELRVLREENTSLRQQLRALEAGAPGSLASDVQQLTADAQETVQDLRKVRRASGPAACISPPCCLCQTCAAKVAVPKGRPRCPPIALQMRKERDALLVRVQQAEAALEGERNLHRRELRRKLREQQDLAAELGAAKDQIRELRLKCRELTQELDLAQRRSKVASLRWA